MKPEILKLRTAEPRAEHEAILHCITYVYLCLKMRLACILLLYTCALNKVIFTIVLRQNILILQFANHCSIALNQEALLLLHPFAIRNFSTVLEK